MEIRELILNNFGKFTGKTIQIEEGINILYGENESGKTTLHTFIKGMLFGMERGRGRASAYDTFSIYEPWENPNYYSGSLRFESGGKIFRIDRNFDRCTKKAELICEDDGEQLSVADGDLAVVIGELNAGNYENTISIGQLKVETNKVLASEFKNHAVERSSLAKEVCPHGNGEINLEKALDHLKEKKKVLEREIKASLLQRQVRRERMEQEASYIWREVHRLEEEYVRITEGIHHRQEKELAGERENAENKLVIDELRPDKWRIHPVEIIAFAGVIVLAFILISKPWNYLVSIILFLACGIYVWNRMKVGKQQEKTPPEIILEEITPEEEKIPKEKLLWEQSHVKEELKEKKTQYGNLQEQLAELDEISDDLREYDKRRSALLLAMERLNELSVQMQMQLEEWLKGRTSEILAYITDNKYTKVLLEEGFHLSVLKDGRRVPAEQLSRGAVEQIYFALRMASSELLHQEEYPVILDDTFAYYDDVRLRNTLRWLGEQKKQVLIFTCQKREIKILDEIQMRYHKIDI